MSALKSSSEDGSLLHEDKTVALNWHEVPNKLSPQQQTPLG